MTTEQTKSQFNQLTPTEQQRVKRTAGEIARFGREMFWQETGSHADDPANWWYVVYCVMTGRVS